MHFLDEKTSRVIGLLRLQFNLELGLFAILFWVMVVGLDSRRSDSESNSHIQPRQAGGMVSAQC